MIPQEQGKASFADSTSGEFEDGLGCFSLRGAEVRPIAFQEDIAGHEAGSSITVHERVISHDPGDVSGSQLRQIALRVGKNLAGAAERGLK